MSRRLKAKIKETGATPLQARMAGILEQVNGTECAVEFLRDLQRVRETAGERARTGGRAMDMPARQPGPHKEEVHAATGDA